VTNASKTGPRAQYGRRERGDARSTRWPALDRALHDAEEAADGAAETRAAIRAAKRAKEQASFDFDEAGQDGQGLGSGEASHGEAAQDA
jgi:hypothetical protein